MFVEFRKYVIPVFLYTTVLLLGFFVGIYVANTSEAYYSDNNLKILAKHGDYTYETYLSGNISAANVALLDYLGEIDSAIKSNETYNKALYSDKMLALGRLTLLAEASGNSTEGRKYLDLAISVCNELKSEKCSDTSVRERVKRIDDIRQKK